MSHRHTSLASRARLDQLLGKRVALAQATDALRGNRSLRGQLMECELALDALEQEIATARIRHRDALDCERIRK